MTEAGCSTMGRRGPSIHDIAKIAGVSAATVSNVLNDKGRVSKRTRLMVQEVARSQGYVANFAAKGLREQQTHTVGIVTPDVSNVFHSVIVLRVEPLLHETGYDAFICNSSNDPARMRSYVEGDLGDRSHRGGSATAPASSCGTSRRGGRTPTGRTPCRARRRREATATRGSPSRGSRSPSGPTRRRSWSCRRWSSREFPSRRRVADCAFPLHRNRRLHFSVRPKVQSAPFGEAAGAECAFP